jgi:hypothetical protein
MVLDINAHLCLDTEILTVLFVNKSNMLLILQLPYKSLSSSSMISTFTVVLIKMQGLLWAMIAK